MLNFLVCKIKEWEFQEKKIFFCLSVPPHFYTHSVLRSSRFISWWRKKQKTAGWGFFFVKSISRKFLLSWLICWWVEVPNIWENGDKRFVVNSFLWISKFQTTKSLVFQVSAGVLTEFSSFSFVFSWFFRIVPHCKTRLNFGLIHQLSKRNGMSENKNEKKKKKKVGTRIRWRLSAN